MTPNLSTFRGRLAFARSLSGLSQYRLSKLARLYKSHVGLLESGRPSGEGGPPRGERVDADTARKIADVLGLSLDWLIAGKGDAPTEEQVRSAAQKALATFAEDDAAPAATGTDGV